MGLDACYRLLGLLREEAGWPLPIADLDDLTFTYKKSEIQFLRNESAQVERILQLRPMPGLKRTVFIIDQGDNDLHRFAIRRIAMHFSTRPKRLAPRPYFPLGDIVFLVISSVELVSVAHFQGSSGLSAAMAVAGPEPLDDCDLLVEQIHWTNFREAEWSLEPSLYVRHDRSRSRNRCSRSYLIENCPEMLDLYDVACLVDAISQAEEDRWFWHARQGSAWAVELIVEYNLRIVFDVAYRFCKQYEACRVPFEDVFSGGIEGLMLAIDKYEFERGHRFASFAWQWVANKADRIFVESLWPVNVPYYVWEKAGPACRDFALVKAVNEYPPVNKTLAESLRLEDHLTEVVRVLTWDNSELVDVEELVDIPDLGAEDAYNIMLEAISLPSLLGDLNEREQDVVLLRNGLHVQAWGHELTLEQVANRYELTRERVRQIEMKAMKKLRQNGEDART